MYQAVCRFWKRFEFSFALCFHRAVPCPVPISAAHGPGRIGRCLALLVAVLSVAGAAEAQNRIRDFTEPVLVHGTDGHYAPVRSLLFADAGGSTLLSAGRDKVVHQWNLTGPELSPTRTLRPPKNACNARAPQNARGTFG